MFNRRVTDAVKYISFFVLFGLELIIMESEEEHVVVSSSDSNAVPKVHL